MIIGAIIAVLYAAIPYIGFHLNFSPFKNEMTKKSVYAGLIITALFFVFLRELFSVTANLDFSHVYIALTGLTFLAYTRTSKICAEKATRLMGHLNGMIRVAHHGFMGILIANIPGENIEILLLGLPILVTKFAGTYERIKNREHFRVPSNYEYFSDIFVVVMYFVAQQLFIGQTMFALALSVVTGVLFKDILEMVYSTKEVLPSRMVLGSAAFSAYFILISLL